MWNTSIHQYIVYRTMCIPRFSPSANFNLYNTVWWCFYSISLISLRRQSLSGSRARRAVLLRAHAWLISSLSKKKALLLTVGVTITMEEHASNDGRKESNESAITASKH